MSEVAKSSTRSFTPYQLLGWTPLLITVVGATAVVIASVLRDL